MAGEFANIKWIALKDFRENATSKRFILIGAIYCFLALLIMLLAVGSYYLSDDYSRAQFHPNMVLYLMDGLNFIMALLAIIISSDAISGEKSQRTIYQLMSKPVKRSSLVLGKFLGALSVVTLFFLVSAIGAYLLTSIVTLRFPAITEIPAIVLILISMLSVYTVYVSFGILISAITKNPYISMIGSLIAWICTIFLSIFGNFLGNLLSSTGNVIMLMGVRFEDYPLIAKIMIWLDPQSHSLAGPLLSVPVQDSIVGLPLWANFLILVLYSVILLGGAVMLFKYDEL